MGAQLRVYRRRIRSVQSTRKITKAMELIAASRIVKAQARMRASRPYADELTRALEALSEDSSLKHPMLTGVDNPTRAGILVITSDRGLAGGYSANAIKCANQLAERLQGEGKHVSRYVIGRKGTVYYNFRRIPIAGSWTGFSEQPNFADARGATETVVGALTAAAAADGDAGESGIDELYVVYTQFKNSVTQIATAIQLSPVKAGDDEQASGSSGAGSSGSGSSGSGSSGADGDGPKPIYDFEPEADQLIGALLPRYISARIYSALLESAASESAARRRAMKSASDNASDLIDDYTRLANQARQAEITQEISEIVGGADALASAGSDQR